MLSTAPMEATMIPRTASESSYLARYNRLNAVDIGYYQIFPVRPSLLTSW